jgi:REP element-mobilizing transposase RayT
MYLFNDTKYRHSGDPNEKLATLSLQEALGDERDQFVAIASYILMPNHYHLFVRQIKDGGIPSFMHKLGMGYALYAARKFGRAGNFFEGPYKAIHIVDDAHRGHLPRYVHLNALDLTGLQWRDGKISSEDWPRALECLDKYPWSSHNLYRGEPQQLAYADPQEHKNFFDGPADYVAFLRGWTGREGGVLFADTVS